jgi:hypothetical protein
VGVVIVPHEQAMMTMARIAPIRMNQNLLGVLIDILLLEARRLAGLFFFTDLSLHKLYNDSPAER